MFPGGSKFQSLIGILVSFNDRVDPAVGEQLAVSIPNRNFSKFQLMISLKILPGMKRGIEYSQIVSIPNRDFSKFQQRRFTLSYWLFCFNP